ncbi:Predicted nucleotidyltransferase [Halanaerobium congolense]|uniref:Predicted nucleotidyltransferase n=1 Tax=Halanaerobium congolense TaxID=54121 RepID=A0A1G8T3B4_9FIRM|nr:nucleotidyltransferase domain-containing protein [Halanaerobium congolense]SDJ36058.1 Predicted nucleotidyltransferase [Halanaerobium congolense]SET65436.1 Predicted nucleotidyltransferase [Halanaerobium congolense]
MNLEVPTNIINKYNIELFVVFGSYADDNNKKGSDLDLGYKCSEFLTESEKMELLNELSQFYQRADIDLVNLTKAEPILKVEIAKKGKLLYGSEEKFEKFSIYAAGIYADTKFLYDDRRKTLEKKIEARY